MVAGGLTALVVVLLSPFASANPDGLERVAMDLGFINRGAEAPFSILSDYAIPWLNEGAGSTILAGAVGALVVAAIAAGLTWFMRRRHRSGINVS